MDPLTEKYPGVSPYAYCLNNPIVLIDPDGREVLPSNAFLNSSYGSTYKKLRQNSKTFNGLISKFENNSKFNLRLKINDKGVSVGAAATTVYNNHDGYIPKSLDVITNFKSHISVGKGYESSEFGLLLIVAHEAIHQKLSLSSKTEDQNHNLYNSKLDLLINVISEYNESNGCKLSDTQIKEIALGGQQQSKDFKSYIESLAKEKNTTYKEEKDSYDERLSGLIYQKKTTTNESKN